MRKKREPRPKHPSEVPLDDGARDGTEAWRVLDGVSFCHWDRWLLRLSLEAPEGLSAIGSGLRHRARGTRRTDLVAEAMLAQLADLETRLERLGRTPNALLDHVERDSIWLRNKAFRRVWHATSIRRTDAMQRTPRRLLEARALHGNWASFPVSPAPFFTRLRAVYRDGYFDYRGVGLVIFQMELESERQFALCTNDDERLAVRRAILGAAISAMEHVDDSGNALGQHFRNHERSYLEALQDYVERPGLMRDLLELAVWEDYGLFRQIEPFLGQLPERVANHALRELELIIDELREAGLDYQCDKAVRLQRATLRAAAPLTPAT